MPNVAGEFQDAALLGEQQSNHHAQAEHGDGILFFQANPCDHAEPEPIARSIFNTSTLDGQDGEVRASHPEVGFQAVRPQQAAIR